MSLRPLDELDAMIVRHPREKTYAQIDELVAWLRRTPSVEQLRSIRREAYAEFDRGTHE